MPEIEEYGSMNRICPSCNKEDVIIHFKADGRDEHLCRSCLFEKYGYGKPHRRRDLLGTYTICTKCQQDSMRKLKDKIEDKPDHLLHHWECDKCGYHQTEKIKKWRKGDKK